MDSSEALFSRKDLTNLLWPILIEQLLNVAVGAVDVIMVASLGEAAVSGVSLVDSINILIIQFLGAMTTGGTVVASRMLGMKDYSSASRTSGSLLTITLIFTGTVSLCFLAGGRFLLALIFGRVEEDVMQSALIYFLITACSFPFLGAYNTGAALFRAQSDSKVSMEVSLLMNLLNICGNALCIFVLKMGVAGVALPTLCSRIFAALLVWKLLQKPQNPLRLTDPSCLRPERRLVGQILSIGIPGGIESSMFQTGKLILQSLVSTMGTASIAGYAVACNIVTFLYLPGNSLGIGLSTIIGRCIGAGKNHQAKYYTVRLLAANYILLLFLAGVIGLARKDFIAIYQLSEASSRIASDMILTHCFAMLIWPVSFLLPHAFRAAGDAPFIMTVSIGSMWLFRVGLSYFFVGSLHGGIHSIWIAMYIDWLFRAILFLWRFKDFDRRLDAFTRARPLPHPDS